MKLTENNMWFQQNSIENNERYIEKLFIKFKISHNFAYDKNGLIVYFYYKFNEYKAYIDRNKKRLILLKKNKSNNYKRKEFYHFFKEFDLDVWYEMLKFVVRN